VSIFPTHPACGQSIRTSRAKKEAFVDSAAALLAFVRPIPLLDTFNRATLPGACSRLPQRRLNPTMLNVLHILDRVPFRPSLWVPKNAHDRAGARFTALSHWQELCHGKRHSPEFVRCFIIGAYESGSWERNPQWRGRLGQNCSGLGYCDRALSTGVLSNGLATNICDRLQGSSLRLRLSRCQAE